MKKLIVTALLCTILTGCATEEVPVTSDYQIEFTEEDVQRCNEAALLLGIEISDYVEVVNDEQFTFCNCYATDGTKVSFVYKGNLVLVYNPDTSYIYLGDTSVDCLTAIDTFTKLDSAMYAKNLAKLQTTKYAKYAPTFASVIGNSAIIRVQNDCIIADKTTYKVGADNSLIGESNSIDVQAYRPLLFECFYKTLNTKAFSEALTLELPISVVELNDSLKEYSSTKSLVACLDEDVLLDKLELSDELSTPVISLVWNDDLVEKTEDTLIADNNYLTITCTVEANDAALFISQFGSPNVVYTDVAEMGWISYTARYRLDDDSSAAFIDICFDEALGDTTHDIRNVVLTYYNMEQPSLAEKNTDPIYSSEELMEDINSYAG